MESNSNINWLDKELSQIDNLYSEIQKHNYHSFTLLLISILISIINPNIDFLFTFEQLKLPRLLTIFGLYFAIIFKTYICYTLFSRVFKNSILDNRKVGHSWIGYSSSKKLPLFFIFLPLLLSQFSSIYYVSNSFLIAFLYFFLSIIIVFSPILIEKYIDLITHRKDERGGNTTFSIYLLYIYRLLRFILGAICIVFIPMVSIVPEISKTLYTLSFFKEAFSIFSGIFIIPRVICGFKFVYERIDTFGIRFGFPDKSEHY
jgi:hypothetical protein